MEVILLTCRHSANVCVSGSLSDEYIYKLADNLLDAMTNGEHSKSLKETQPVSSRRRVLAEVRRCSRRSVAVTRPCVFVSGRRRSQKKHGRAKVTRR